ncbi:MAG: leucine-rich repeat domain-containing protein [Spirochaetaceae bacterium]|jgi:hypothetical protein|nr:leucine-rich repeat domain-containing protein [Spirochaetaceae bacterium]
MKKRVLLGLAVAVMAVAGYAEGGQEGRVVGNPALEEARKEMVRKQNAQGGQGQPVSPGPTTQSGAQNAQSGGISLTAQEAAAAGFQYEVNNGGVTITEYMGNARNVTIPGRINNLPVTAIGDYSFWDNRLTGVTIPNSVTYIGDNAFTYNPLTSVTIGNAVTYIGDFAFLDNQLTSVAIPNSVTAIGDSAFVGRSLTSITIGANVDVWNSFGEVFSDAYAEEGYRAGTYRVDKGLLGLSYTWRRQ